MGTGPSTASQTAWGAMVLLEVFGKDDPDLWRALRWLAAHQLSPVDAADPALNPDGDPAGSWCETEFTGTGCPQSFSLRAHLYRLYFPLMAIGRALAAHGVAVQNGAVEANSTRSPEAGWTNDSRSAWRQSLSAMARTSGGA